MVTLKYNHGILLLGIFLVVTKINLEKKHVIWGRSSKGLHDMANRLGCSSGQFLITYLVLPFGSFMNQSSWGKVEENVKNKLFAWNANNTSIYGCYSYKFIIICSVSVFLLNVSCPCECFENHRKFDSQNFLGGDENFLLILDFKIVINMLSY